MLVQNSAKGNKNHMKKPRISPEALEKYSSAVSLSDMEIFIFPELLYSLVLANIMSPRIWAWKQDSWFKKIDQMSPYRRVQRLKQFIMNNYEFNLDLDTWGLTTQENEKDRFRDFIDEDTLAKSNALFGYEGDKYYFDLDIRRHFGLDHYDAHIIPYWKTETLEAMDAFRHCDGYTEGAGECVSLSTLYAAALFVICKIPLEEIFLLATPLHSQNFVSINEGILTNNRRIVTRNMWFNGSELSDKAQRALRNEQITIVANNTGYAHVLNEESTINPDQYAGFKHHLEDYLHTDITFEILANFLRFHSHLMKCFQVRQEYHGKPRYIESEKVYAYEHTSSYRLGDDTRDKLLESIDNYEYYAEPLPNRILLNDFHDFLEKEHLDLDRDEDREKLKVKFTCVNTHADEVVADLVAFTHIDPKYPEAVRPHRFVDSAPIAITPDMDREAIIAYLTSIREQHSTADLAFYAFRDLAVTDWQPFLIAAMDRNPVCIDGSKDVTDEDLADHLAKMANESIYNGSRAAQPDEVWNFQRGDGLEKAITLAAIWKSRHPDDVLKLNTTSEAVTLAYGPHSVTWAGSKGLQVSIDL